MWHAPGMLLALFLTACASSVEAPTPPAPVATDAIAPIPDASDAPAGRIGGEPILPHPTVVGGISNRDVEEGMAAHRDAIRACWEAQRALTPTLAGKVLVKFTIRPDGAVGEVTTRSTSLRHPATEACVNAAVANARFPALTGGRLAIVHYPFAFPPEG